MQLPQRLSVVGALGLTLVAALSVTVAPAAETGKSAIDDLIRQAGNAEDDARRLELLKRLRGAPDLAPRLKADAERLVAFVERWQTDRSLWQWFDREIRRTVDYDFQIAKDSPLYPVTCLYRGRMLVWAANEYGNIIGYHEPRRRFFDKAVAEFRVARAAFPENRILRMYLGEPFPPVKQYAAIPAAPDWANLQRENLERLADVVQWWIDHRLRPNGEYGGAWDDDCEMWRHWVPVMIAFDEPRIARAQAFFSEALLKQPYMKGGYTSHVYDVEHTAEPSTDTILPMMHLAPDDPAWKARALRLAELMEKVWTGTNERGMVQFRSTYFNFERVDPNPRRGCDVPYNVISVQPALLLWQRTADPRLGRQFSRWMDTWVEAAARSEHGKPAGVLPAVIRWPDGAVVGPGEHWWDPRHHDEPRLYEWPAAVDRLADTLLLTWRMTGDEKYLRPVRSMAELRRAWLERPSREPPAPGSTEWCASKMGFLAGTLAKHKLLTGSGEFDRVLRSDYRALAISEGDQHRKALADALRTSAEALRVNFPGYTSEVRFTDRVLTFPRLFGADMLFAEAVPACAKRPDPQLLYATATGDRGGFGIFPLNAVRWLTPPREIAALVTRASPDGLSAELFHFGDAQRPMAAELYLLRPGRYTLDLRTAAGRAVAAAKTFPVRGPRVRVEFALPPRELCTLRVETAAESHH